MGYFRLKLGLLGGARQGPEPEQEPGPLLVHCTRRDVKVTIFMKMDDIRPKANPKKKEGDNQSSPSKGPFIYEAVCTHDSYSPRFAISLLGLCCERSQLSLERSGWPKENLTCRVSTAT
jgi:hypothetical protein